MTKIAMRIIPTIETHFMSVRIVPGRAEVESTKFEPLWRRELKKSPIPPNQPPTFSVAPSPNHQPNAFWIIPFFFSGIGCGWM